MKKILVLLSSALVLVTSSYALDSVRISGYATAAGGYISDSSVGATNFNSDPGHDGYAEESLKFQPDSVAGLQISSRVADDVTVSMQLVGQFENETGSIELEWAYINYELSDDFTIQAGRFVPQVFLYSNTVNVGFTYLWITPPSEVYDQAPIRYTDGANLLLDHTFSNDVTLEASVYASNVSQDIVFAGQSFPSKYENLLGAAASISNEYFKLRVGHMQTKMSTSLNDSASFGPLVAGPGNLTNPGLDNTDGIKSDDAEGRFSSVGLTMDVADIIVIGEYTVRNIKDSAFTEDTTSYYGTLGYRMGNFTPHITYSVLETEFKDSNDALVLSIVDPITGTVTTSPTFATVGSFRSALSTDSETVALGLRYDLNSKTALKFEYQNINKSPQEIDFTTGASIHDETSAELYKIALSVIF